MGPGGAGGALGTVTLEGYNFQVVSGDGGLGVTAGGAGGAITSVNVLGSAGALPGDNFHVQSLVVTTGAGGQGTAGTGGAGGALGTLTVANADFTSTHAAITATPVAGGYQVSAGAQVANGLQVTTGIGGEGDKGAGGVGGAMTNLTINSIDFLTISHPQGNSGLANITTGGGGASLYLNGVGGAGGAMSNVTLIGTRLAVPNISTGSWYMGES